MTPGLIVYYSTAITRILPEFCDQVARLLLHLLCCGFPLFVIIPEEMKQSVNQQSSQFFVEREVVFKGLPFRTMEIDDDVSERKGAGGRRTLNQNRPTPAFSQLSLQLIRGILWKRQNIRCTIHPAVYGIEKPHSPVAHEEDAEISPRESEQAEKFPEKPCRFGRVYLYELLLVLYGDLHCQNRSPDNPRVYGKYRSGYT